MAQWTLVICWYLSALLSQVTAMQYGVTLAWLVEIQPRYVNGSYDNTDTDN